MKKYLSSLLLMMGMGLMPVHHVNAQALIPNGADIIHHAKGRPTVIGVQVQVKEMKIDGLMTAVVPDLGKRVTVSHLDGEKVTADVAILRKKKQYLVYGTVWFGQAALPHDDKEASLPVPVSFREVIELKDEHPKTIRIKGTPVSVSFMLMGDKDKDEADD